ncbi:MAG: hypothetical protein ACLUIO_21210, partial [Neglectibacter timonensis]
SVAANNTNKSQKSGNLSFHRLLYINAYIELIFFVSCIPLFDPLSDPEQERNGWSGQEPTFGFLGLFREKSVRKHRRQADKCPDRSS